MFVPTFGGDDWHAIVRPDFQYGLIVAIGRWMNLLVWRLADGNSFGPATGVAVLSLALLFLALACCRALGIRRPGIIVAFAALLVSFPIMAETFSFKQNHFPNAAGILLATGGGLMTIEAWTCLGRGARRAALLRSVAAVVCITLSSACSQQTMHFTVALLLAHLVGLSRQPAPAAIGRREARGLLFGLAILAAGLTVYAVSVPLSQHLLDIPTFSGRGGHSMGAGMVQSPEELAQGVRSFLTGWGSFLFLSTHLFPLPLKLAFYAALAVCLVLAPRWRERICLAVCTLLMLALPFALAIVRVEAVFRFTAIIALAVPYAMVFALMADHLHRRRRGRWACAALIGMTLLFCFEQNKASLSTVLLNQRDRAVAARILTRLQAAPEFAPFATTGVLPILVVGQLEDRMPPYPFAPDSPDAPPPQNYSIDSCGVFNCSIGRLEPLLQLIGEATMRYPVSVWQHRPAEMTDPALSDRIAAAPPWPAPGSMIWTADGVVLVLGRTAPQRPAP
ncbi:glucosyltransferase domain-containing protein [Phaeospirillum tilakii]|uniref:Glucosyltransferase domain-containing protein n=1 Tax=Phaeospirillum tilakii TaxID=741673 RepID=A0ABW5C7J8_9PROT